MLSCGQTMYLKKIQRIRKNRAASEAPTPLSPVHAEHVAQGQVQEIDLGAHCPGGGKRFEVLLQVMLQPFADIFTGM